MVASKSSLTMYLNKIGRSAKSGGMRKPDRFARNPEEDLNRPIDRSNRSNGHRVPTSSDVNQSSRAAFVGVSNILRGQKVVSGILKFHAITFSG